MHVKIAFLKFLFILLLELFEYLLNFGALNCADSLTAAYG